MHPRLKFFLQTRVDQAVTSKRLHLGSYIYVWLEKCGQSILPNLVELWTDDHHLEVGLASLGHIVHVGLVDHLADRKNWPIVLRMVHCSRKFTSRCSGLNLSVSLVLIEAATLPSSPAMVNLGSSTVVFVKNTQFDAHLVAVFKWPSLPNLPSKPAVAIQQRPVCTESGYFAGVAVCFDQRCRRPQQHCF